MGSRKKSKYSPDYDVSPGEILQDWIDNKNGGMTDEVASLLEKMTGYPAAIWKNLQANYERRRNAIALTKGLLSDLRMTEAKASAELAGYFSHRKTKIAKGEKEHDEHEDGQ